MKTLHEICREIQAIERDREQMQREYNALGDALCELDKERKALYAAKEAAEDSAAWDHASALEMAGKFDPSEADDFGPYLTRE